METSGKRIDQMNGAIASYCIEDCRNIIIDRIEKLWKCQFENENVYLFE